MVLEDEQAITEVLDKFLSGKGFEVIKTSEGNKALEIIRTRTDMDLMILDMKMPGIRGIDVLRELRNMGIKLPIIIMTGSIDLSIYIDDLNEMGYSEKDVLFKPIDLYRILDMINEKLHKN